MEFIKWLFILVCSICFIGGIINGIIEIKHGKKKSGSGFWGVFTFLAIIELFDSISKKK